MKNKQKITKKQSEKLELTVPACDSFNNERVGLLNKCFNAVVHSFLSEMYWSLCSGSSGEIYIRLDGTPLDNSNVYEELRTEVVEKVREYFDKYGFELDESANDPNALTLFVKDKSK